MDPGRTCRLLVRDTPSPGPPFHVAALTGLRRGELCGLRWEDVDLDAAELRVLQAVTTPNGRLTFGPPKSTKSRRTVSLDASIADRLEDQIALAADLEVAASDRWTDSGLVFVNNIGGVIDPNNPSKRFAAAVNCQGKELSHLSFHGLRHTHATHLLAAGVSSPYSEGVPVAANCRGVVVHRDGSGYRAVRSRGQSALRCLFVWEANDFSTVRPWLLD